MPRPIIYLLLVVVALTLIPMGIVYKSRQMRKTSPRIQVVYDMDQQSYAETQSENAFFADGASMHHQPAGTVARGHLQADDGYFRGIVRDTIFVEDIPVEITRELLDRGQERFTIFCAPCHGTSGNGNGMAHIRAQALAEGTWTPPTDLTSTTVIERPAGHIYNSIANGIRNMPSYGAQVGPDDRWAITAYVRALQLSRNAKSEDVPAAVRADAAR